MQRTGSFAAARKRNKKPEPHRLPHLSHLDSSGFELEPLDLSMCAELESVTCSQSNLQSVHVTTATATLKSAQCDSCTNLKVVFAAGCKIMGTIDAMLLHWQQWTWCHCQQLRLFDCVGCESMQNLDAVRSETFGEVIAIASLPSAK